MRATAIEPYDEFRHRIVHELMDKNARVESEFRIGSWPRYDFDLENHELVFSENGVPQVIADIRVVGTVQGDEWEWSWENPNLPHASTCEMSRVRTFGQNRNYERLTTAFLTADEFLGWECAAIAAYALDAKGAYRARTEVGFIYFVYLDLRWSDENKILQ
jgi:hypothetical protein